MTPLHGLRVLVVEDEGAVAMLIEEMLEDLGCVVVASVARLAKASDVARSIEVDLAVLDETWPASLSFLSLRFCATAIFPFSSVRDMAPADSRVSSLCVPYCTSRFRKKNWRQRSFFALAMTRGESIKTSS